MSDDTIADLSGAIIPKSDQINADDLIGGPRTVTITRVVRGPSPEQPIELRLAECKPYRPGKSMSRVLVAAWGPHPAEWPVPARVTIYRDPSVRFGGAEVGGIRISHLSGIDRPLDLALTVTRGKRSPYRVLPLPDPPATQTPPSLAEVLFSADLTVQQVDAWLASQRKPLLADRDDASRAKLAAWIAADATRVDMIRAVTP